MTRHLGCLIALLACACDDGGNPSATDAAAPDALDAAVPLDAQPDVGPAIGPGLRSTALAPNRPADWYLEQADRYFDTLDSRADPERVPAYSEQVARWEWPPWLYLTGYGRDQIIATTRGAHSVDPSTVESRDCRVFDQQPFARCYVVFQYEGGACPIYEEFTFSDLGEMNFVEAWSDRPGWLPFDDPTDRWAEGPGIRRLSTKVPGLGDPGGLADLQAAWMLTAAAEDAEVADFVRRASNFWAAFGEALRESGPNLYARGCGWTE